MSSGGAWTEAEKIELLMSIVDTHVGSAIKWPDVTVPNGRTVKSCTHVIAKLRSIVRNGSAPTTPKKTSQAATPNKRKRTIKDINGDEDDDEEYLTPQNGRKGKGKSRQKAGKTDADAAKPQDSDGRDDDNNEDDVDVDEDDKAKVSVVKDEGEDGSDEVEMNGAESDKEYV